MRRHQLLRGPYPVHGGGYDPARVSCAFSARIYARSAERASVLSAQDPHGRGGPGLDTRQRDCRIVVSAQFFPEIRKARPEHFRHERRKKLREIRVPDAGVPVGRDDFRKLRPALSGEKVPDGLIRRAVIPSSRRERRPFQISLKGDRAEGRIPEILRMNGIRKEDEKEYIDMVAAKVILESYLGTLGGEGR